MPNNLLQRQFSGGRRTTLEIRSAVLRQFCCTTSTWEGSTEETSCVGTMPVERRVGSSIDTYFTFFLTLRSPMLTFFRRTFVQRMSTRMLKEFRLQLAQELMGDYSSRCRAGRRPSQITTLPLCHFPIRIPIEIPDESHRRNFSEEGVDVEGKSGNGNLLSALALACDVMFRHSIVYSYDDSVRAHL